MKRFALSLIAALAGVGFAFAHAQLETASPPVGGAVEAPTEIRLVFSEGVEPAFSSVSLADAGGAAHAVGKPSVAKGDDKTLVVKVGGRLAPGVYTVSWRVVSKDTHRTQGRFEFTVKR